MGDRSCEASDLAVVAHRVRSYTTTPRCRTSFRAVSRTRMRLAAAHAVGMEAHAGHRSLRAGRASLQGQAYFVTTVVMNRAPLFHDWQVAVAACRQIHDPATWGDAEALCWVLMPDHWHGLVRLGDRDTLSTTVNRLKACVTKAVRAVKREIAPVWSRAYHDHALRNDEALLDVARYIVLNPVRAGIVRRVGDYPFWNAAWLPQETARPPG